MKTGFRSLPVRRLLSGGLLALGLVFLPGSALAGETLAKVTWESRWTEETKGGLIEHPPFVAVNDVRLYRFSEMQTVTWRDTLEIDHAEEGLEKLYVFTIWQGGASQGEQLMLLSVRPQGIALTGPYKQDFERLEIGHVNSESAPEFDLVGADGEIIASVDYVLGELLPRED